MSARWWWIRAGAVAVIVLLGACDGTETTTSTTTATAGPTSASTAPTDTLTVQVFFLDEDAFNVGRPPYVVPVERTVPTEDPEAAALEALFAGPTESERVEGLRFVASEATGVTDVRVVDGTAHVTLVGGCSSGGSTFTVADEIFATLVQFQDVVAVKIYGPDGDTQRADEPGDSLPACLEP